MMAWFKQHLPTPESVQNNRWLRWMGPSLAHPRLWRMSRKGLALGMSIGIFFGLLVPVAQIPLSALVAVAMRANLPVAMGSTLVTNPITFGPLYYAAYQVGVSIVGTPPKPAADAQEVMAQAPDPQVVERLGWRQQLRQLWRYLTGVGKPLVVGLALFAVLGGFLTYFISSLIWTLGVRRRRRQRLAQRRQRKGLS